MLQTLALAAALSLAPAQQPGALALTNDRITFGGEFGPPRPSPVSAGRYVLPGLRHR